MNLVFFVSEYIYLGRAIFSFYLFYGDVRTVSKFVKYLHENLNQ